MSQAHHGPLTRTGTERATPASPQVTFETFAHNHYRELVRYAMYCGLSEHDAQDVVSDVMKMLILRWTSIDDPPAYVRVAVLNGVRKHYRRRREEPRDPGTLPDSPAECTELIDWEDHEWLKQLAMHLPPSQRDVFLLVYVHGMTGPEVADRLGRTPAAVRQALTAARRRLRPLIDDSSTAPTEADFPRKGTR